MNKNKNECVSKFAKKSNHLSKWLLYCCPVPISFANNARRNALAAAN